MKWNRQTIKTVAIVFATVAFTAFMLKVTMDHDGETGTLGTLGGDDPSSSAPATPGGNDDGPGSSGPRASSPETSTPTRGCGGSSRTTCRSSPRALSR